MTLHRRRPSPDYSWVGSCTNSFEACSAFTRVTTCTLAKSPSDPLHRRLRQLRCLRCRFDCYRVERTSSRAGVAPTEVQRLFTAHFIASYLLLELNTHRRLRAYPALCVQPTPRKLQATTRRQPG